jgi:hypothetical protein
METSWLKCICDWFLKFSKISSYLIKIYVSVSGKYDKNTHSSNLLVPLISLPAVHEKADPQRARQILVPAGCTRLEF